MRPAAAQSVVPEKPSYCAVALFAPKRELHYFPVNTGLRFSMKAVRPSA